MQLPIRAYVTISVVPTSSQVHTDGGSVFGGGSSPQQPPCSCNTCKLQHWRYTAGYQIKTIFCRQVFFWTICRYLKVTYFTSKDWHGRIQTMCCKPGIRHLWIPAPGFMSPATTITVSSVCMFPFLFPFYHYYEEQRFRISRDGLVTLQASVHS